MDRSERPVPDQRLRAITFDVVNRFSKTRRISRALAVPHPWVRAAYLAPPASFSSGLRPALVRCQVAQGPRSRAGFAARGGGGGVGMVLGRAPARLEYVSLAILLSHYIPSTALTRRRRCYANFCQPNSTRYQCDIPCRRLRPDYTKPLALVAFVRPSEAAEPTEARTALFAKMMGSAERNGGS